MLASNLVVGGGFALSGAAVADGGTGGTGGTGGSGAVATLHFPGLIDQKNGHISINGDSGDTSGGLYQLDTGPDTWLETYCIDFQTETANHAKYQETNWSSTSLQNNAGKGKILWILQNSYPNVTDLAALANKVGAKSLDTAQAAAATQAAIWKYSDNLDAEPVTDLRGPDTKRLRDEDAAKLTSYLISNAADLAEPSPSLALTPQSVSGKSGELIGPVTVNSTGGSVAVSLDTTSTAAGVVLTDVDGKVLSGKDGKLITPAKPTDRLFVKAPAGAEAGTATLSASTSTDVELGRAFVSSDSNGLRHDSQTLILAGTKALTVTATATATWAPAGPIPAISAAVECSQHAVVVKATNNGDRDFTFTLAGQTVTVKPGATATVPVPVQQGQHYDIKVTGLNGKVFEFTGILDCQVASTTGGTASGGSSAGTGGAATPPSRPATPAGTTGGTGSTGGSGLAATGGGGATPLLAGIAAALVLAGGGGVYALRRRGRHGRHGRTAV